VARVAQSPQRGLARASAICLAFGLIAGVFASAHAAEKNERAWRAVQQLLRTQLPSGQFDFEYDFLQSGVRPKTRIGVGKLEVITREAGTAYGLSTYFLHDHDESVRRALAAILTNLETLSLPIAKAPGQATLEATGLIRLPFARYKLHDTLHALGLLYRSKGDGRLVSYDKSYDTAWGGATALALLTELQFYQASHDRRFESARQAWLRGLLVLYDRGAGFRSLPDAIDENALSNGEIWLALASYARLFPDDRELAGTVAQVDGYMLGTYGATFNHDIYSWAMQAAAERLRATGDAKFAQFIATQTRLRLAETRPASEAREDSCAEVEGLAAALHVLTASTVKDEALVRRLREVIAAEMVKNNALQIQPGQDRIDLGHGATLFSPAIAEHAGAFLAGAQQPYLRIDLTEHCICALLEVEK
jgi:hypothetical protein